jgi:hypothetical protein
MKKRLHSFAQGIGDWDVRPQLGCVDVTLKPVLVRFGAHFTDGLAAQENAANDIQPGAPRPQMLEVASEPRLIGLALQKFAV